MKKKNSIIIGFFLLIFITGCAGYKPIFKSKNLPLIISNYSIEGEKFLGNKIYLKLNNLLKANKNNKDLKKINIIIKVEKNKNIASKDGAGKVLEYRVSLNAKIEVENANNNNEIVNQNFEASVNYKAQNQYSDTISLEKKSIDDLLDRIYQDFLFKLTQNTLPQ